MKYRTPGNILTVIIRDNGPLAMCGDSPSYRSVQIDLTPEQVEKMRLNASYMTGGVDYFEEISLAFIEPKAGA